MSSSISLEIIPLYLGHHELTHRLCPAQLKDVIHMGSYVDGAPWSAATWQPCLPPAESIATLTQSHAQGLVLWWAKQRDVEQECHLANTLMLSPNSAPQLLRFYDKMKESFILYLVLVAMNGPHSPGDINNTPYKSLSWEWHNYLASAITWVLLGDGC